MIAEARSSSLIVGELYLNLIAAKNDMTASLHEKRCIYHTKRFSVVVDQISS